MASSTTLFGDVALGLTTLPSGEVLRDAVRANPELWLGADHVDQFGDDVGLLVKLLDAGERLPVHAHPDVPFARAHLRVSHGKTEAWVFLEGGTVRLGFAREVTEGELGEWVRTQDVGAMLGAMHELVAKPGDAILVPAGTAHAIDEGAFIVELQEPTDLSILLEWTGFAIDGLVDGHLNLGFDTALGAVERRARSAGEIAELRGASAETVGDLLPMAAPFFRVERSRGDAAWEAGFSVIVVVSGEGSMVSDAGQFVPLIRGLTAVLPHAAGSWAVEDSGELEVLRCRPPDPSTRSAARP